jgi:hypothetical protein
VPETEENLLTFEIPYSKMFCMWKLWPCMV